MGDCEAAAATKEELEYLELRRKLKEHYRKQFKQHTCTSALLNASTKPKDDGFGSFFGPSQPTIVPRVIQETTSLLHFAVLRVSNPRHGIKKAVNRTCAAAGIRRPRPKGNVPARLTKVDDPKKLKLQKMKDARDYSFLFSDDATLLLRKKDSAPNPNTPSTQIPEEGRKVLKEMKPVSSNGNTQCSTPQNAKSDSTTIRKKTVSFGHVNCNKAAAALERQTGSKTVSSKMETGIVKKTVTVKFVAKQEVSSTKPQTSKQINKPVTKPVSSQKSLQDRPKKRPLHQRNTDHYDSGFDFRSEIRNMFGYNPNKYRDDDRDTVGMEAGFHDILKEERRSALIARKQDQVEQKRTEAKARAEKMRKDAKRRKLRQS